MVLLTNDFIGLLTTCDQLQTQCNAECYHRFWEMNGKRCDGVVCFKALFGDFRGLIRTQSVWLDFPLRLELGLCVYEGLRATWASWWVILAYFAYTRRRFSTVFQNVSYHTSFMRLMYSKIFWPLNRRLTTRRTLYQAIYLLFVLMFIHTSSLA